jgi:4a-hydroxytetrahydrobiopterin dehydratase
MGTISYLKDKKCVPCEGGTSPLTQREAQILHKQAPTWIIGENNKSISHSYKFKNFVEAMEFVRKVADLAEEEGHHPDISISYNKVDLNLTTHAIEGLSENDFIFATKIDTVK